MLEVARPARTVHGRKRVVLGSMYNQAVSTISARRQSVPQKEDCDSTRSQNPRLGGTLTPDSRPLLFTEYQFMSKTRASEKCKFASVKAIPDDIQNLTETSSSEDLSVIKFS